MHLLTQSALLRALGWSLLNSLWQMALLWLVYAVFVRIFRQASSHVRHGLAVFLLGAGTLWTAVSFFTTFLSADAVPPAASFGLLSFSGAQWVSTFFRAGRQLINEGLPYCSTIYLLIVSILFVRYSKQYLHSRRIIRTGLSKAAPEVRLFTEQTACRMGISKHVSVWLSSLVECPVTLGSLKPVILIPLATVSSLTPQQVEALIVHELAHISKQDYLLNLGIAFLEVLFFFNPFSRLLIRSIQKEREHRCDDLVLQFRYDPQTYVSALLALASGIQGGPRLVLAATGGNDQLLLQRIKRILRLNSNPEPVRGRWLICLFFTLFVAGMLLTRPVFSVNRMAARMMTSEAPGTGQGKTPQTTRETVGMETIVFTSNPAPPKSNREAVPARSLHKKSRTHAMNTDEDVSEDDPNVVQAETPGTEEEDGAAIGYASDVQAERRDYSITGRANVAPKATAPSPYVPNSSFSFQKIQDSTLPGDQSIYMQLLATRQVEQAIARMEKELQGQLKMLQQSSSKDIPDLKQKQQIILEQLKLQQQYLEKQQQLQKKLENIGKKRVIVVI